MTLPTLHLVFFRNGNDVRNFLDNKPSKIAGYKFWPIDGFASGDIEISLDWSNAVRLTSLRTSESAPSGDFYLHIDEANNTVFVHGHWTDLKPRFSNDFILSNVDLASSLMVAYFEEDKFDNSFHALALKRLASVRILPFHGKLMSVENFDVVQTHSFLNTIYIYQFTPERLDTLEEFEDSE